MIVYALILFVAMLLGAFIALYSYHCGRANRSPVPEITFPKVFNRETPPPAENGKHQETARTRTM